LQNSTASFSAHWQFSQIALGGIRFLLVLFSLKCGWHQVTAPLRQRADIKVFCLQFCLLRRKLYFHVSKKEYSISATNKHCAFRKQSVSKPAERKAPKRYG
jgi:hypothetical protein